MPEKLSSEEAIQVHDYFTMNLQDANIDPGKYEAEFKKSFDPNKTWQENLEIMDALIKRIIKSQPKRHFQTPLLMFTSRHKEGDSWMIRDVETGEGKLYNPDDKGDHHEEQRT